MLTSLTPSLFYKFSVVFPYTALFIDLYNTFPYLSPFFAAPNLLGVLNSTDGFSDFKWLNSNTQCIFLVLILTLKSDFYLPKKKSYLFDSKPFKNDENVFYFVLKASFVLKIYKFLLRHFHHTREKSLIRKIRLTSKFMTSQPGLQTIWIHILPNISQSKGNQTMKSGQLIEHNRRYIFLQKLCRKVTSSRPHFIF